MATSAHINQPSLPWNHRGPKRHTRDQLTCGRLFGSELDIHHGVPGTSIVPAAWFCADEDGGREPDANGVIDYALRKPFVPLLRGGGGLAKGKEGKRDIPWA